jgi:glycosyltransferase involved in cell wall biosynthesis
MPTLHMLGLAHLPSIAESPMWACAYTQKMVRMARMMSDRGYRVIFYGVSGSRVSCDEMVSCLTESQRYERYGPISAFARSHFSYGPQDSAYKIFIKNAIREISERSFPGDILINPMGNFYDEICRGVKDLSLVEGGIGYTGVLPYTHHVFESETWRSYIYGSQLKRQDIDFYDVVIPNFYSPSHYRFKSSREDFYLMICRQEWRKGIQIAVDMVERIGGRLVLAGQPGSFHTSSKRVEYLGYIDEDQKLDLLSRAKALLQPTLYLPPFEGVTVEAMFSGCPVITTDHGCFVETVPEGVGFRCRTLRDFARATLDIDSIDPHRCRSWAMKRFSMDVCGPLYDRFFRSLIDLRGDGWYA